MAVTRLPPPLVFLMRGQPSTLVEFACTWRVIFLWPVSRAAFWFYSCGILTATCLGEALVPFLLRAVDRAARACGLFYRMWRFLKPSLLPLFFRRVPPLWSLSAPPPEAPTSAGRWFFFFFFLYVFPTPQSQVQLKSTPENLHFGHCILQLQNFSFGDFKIISISSLTFFTWCDVTVRL